MSRFRPPNEDLAYGDIPQRWDRDRFERFGRGGGGGGAPSQYEDDYRFVERDRPGHRDVAVAERERSRGPGGRFEERDRFFEEERQTARPRRRTDKELFGDLDPREVVDMAMTPYRRRSQTRQELDINQRGARPGLLRRQSSLDTFDRRPARREREPYVVPPYTPVPLPVRRPRGESQYGEDYREVEIQRERSIHRRRPPKSEAGRSVREESKFISRHESDSSSSEDFQEQIERKSVHGGTQRAKSTKAPSTVAPSTHTKARSTRAPTVYEEVHETDIRETWRAPSTHESMHEIEESVREERKFKKGKTRMPKRLVRVEAIMDLGYPFDEEEDFYVLRIALEKEQIDEVISISETYKSDEKKKVYRFEGSTEEPPAPVAEHEVVERTEWINPPTIIGGSGGRSRSRRPSPSAKSSISRRDRSRRPSSPGTYVEERRTIIDEHRSPPPPPPAPEYYEEHKTIIEERAPPRSEAHGSLVLAEREHRSDRDINQEIKRLEAERRALRFEREADEKRDLALRIREQRPDEELQIVEYREREARPSREVFDLVERERSPPRNTVRVEKDRKEKRRETNKKLLGAALASLT